ncbi:MAG: YitT family protein [Alphaproteobacteria bacterium]|nr:YitT family protein [Alphaproteobacteria bacterium]
MWKVIEKNELKSFFITSVGLLVGSFIMACSTAFFLLPNKLSTGGFSGLSTIAYYLFRVPVGTAMIILNLPLFFVAFFRVGKKFIIKSITGTILLSVFINILERFPAVTTDRFLACIYGGIIMGIGTAIILKVSGSTGGSDLLSYVVRSFNDRFKSGDLIITIDTVIIIISILVFKEIEIGLYSAIAIYLMGKMIDIVFEGVDFTKVMFIISDKYDEIARIIGEDVQRGSTAIYAKGMHSSEDKMMLFCVGSRNEIIRIKKIATEIDKKSFIVIFNAREAWGKGFEKDALANYK